MGILESKVPEGTLADKWENHKFSMNLVNPNNKRKFDIIVVGTGLAGASAAATLGELGYRDLHKVYRRQRHLCIRDSPSGPQHRRPGRHQRRQELHQRRRLGPPTLLRHRQGR